VPAFGQEPPAITDVEVEPTPFSPNGDGVRDSLYLRYTLDADVSSMTAEVRDSEGVHTAFLLEGEPRYAGTDTLVWGGLKEDLDRAPDGNYYVRLSARGFSGGESEVDSPLFVLDATRPTVRINELYPSPFAPGLPGSPDSLTVRVEVTGSQPADSVFIGVGPVDEPSTDELSIKPPFSGDGQYTASWKDMGYADGFYRIEVFVQDAALNRSSAGSSFTLDRNPPLIEIYDPPADGSFNPLPELLRGKVYDESGVDSIEVAYDGGPFSVVPGVSGHDTLYWAAPLRDLLSEEGEHTVGVKATDPLGRTGARGYAEGVVTLTVTLDKEPPPPPSLDRLPSVVRTSMLGISGTAEDADSVLIYVNDFEIPAAKARVTIKGTFSGIVELQIGDNQLAARSMDEAGNLSSPPTYAAVEYSREFGVFFNERFRPGDYFEISLDMPVREVTLALYSTSGRLVRLLRGDGPAEYFNLVWDGLDDSGTSLNNGVYLCRVSAVLEDGTTLTEKKLVALVR